MEEALSNQILILDETDILVMTLLDNLEFSNFQRHHEENELRTFERLLHSQARALGACDMQCSRIWSKMSVTCSIMQCYKILKIIIFKVQKRISFFSCFCTEPT